MPVHHDLPEIGSITKKLVADPQEIVFPLMRRTECPGALPHGKRNTGQCSDTRRSEAKNARCADGNAFSNEAAVCLITAAAHHRADIDPVGM